MNSIRRIITFTIAIILIFALGFTYELYNTQKKSNQLLKKQMDTFERKLLDASSQKSRLESDISKMQRERIELVRQIEEQKVLAEKLKTEGDSLRIRLGEMEKLKEALSEKDRLISEKVESLNRLRIIARNYSRKISSLMDNIARGKTAGGVTPSAAAVEVSLEPIEVTSKKALTDARILEVDVKYAFAVVSAGKDKGVSEGDTLYVTRGNTVLGKVVVERVGEEVSVTKILYRSLGDSARRGDSVNY